MGDHHRHIDEKFHGQIHEPVFSDKSAQAILSRVTTPIPDTSVHTYTHTHTHTHTAFKEDDSHICNRAETDFGN